MRGCCDPVERQFSRIAFHATDGTLLDYSSWIKGYNGLQKQLPAKPGESPESFHAYLETVFSYAGDAGVAF